MREGRIRVLSTAFAAVPGSGAHEASMRALMTGLQCELDLITLKTEDLSHIERWGTARMLRVPVGDADRASRAERYRRAVVRHLEAERYDVVHVLDPFAGQAALERRSHDGFALVYEPRTRARDDDRSEWTEAHWAVAKRADQVWLRTRAEADALRARGVERTEIVAPSVDVTRFDWSEAMTNAPPRILYLGSLTATRDVDALFGALALVAHHRPVRALLAGDHDPERRAAMRERIETANLGDAVEVRGAPDPRALPRLIAAADLCLAPSAAEPPDSRAGLAQPLLEYLACYRPVVAADVEGIREWLEDETHLLLYPPGNAGALADAILEILRDAGLRERLTQAGYQKVRDELNSGALRRRVRHLYDMLVPGSQELDAWNEPFEERGLNLSEYTVERLSTKPPPTSDPLLPLVPTEPRGRAETGRSETDPPVDTRPSLELPDTDPGR